MTALQFILGAFVFALLGSVEHSPTLSAVCWGPFAGCVICAALSLIPKSDRRP